METDLTTGFPLQICILDVETEYVEFQNPEGCDLAFVGVKTFVLREGKYQPEQFKWYLPNELAVLEKFLHTFNGLIIGHNIFEFDYRTLRRSLSLGGVLEKTVDTLDFLRRKNGMRLKGLSLDHLSRANLGKSKTLVGASIPELWRQGKRDEVIAYNENDCLLTMELWQHLVIKRSGIIRFYQKTAWSDEGTFKISELDLEELFGKKPNYTYATWMGKIEAGAFTQPKMSDLVFEITYFRHYCKMSNQTFLFKCQDLLGARGDIIKIACPGCGESISILDDHKLLGSVEGYVGNDEFDLLIDTL